MTRPHPIDREFKSGLTLGGQIVGEIVTARENQGLGPIRPYQLNTSQYPIDGTLPLGNGSTSTLRVPETAGEYDHGF